MTVLYNIYSSIILDRAKRDIARAAASAHAENGDSLYDALVNTSRDEEVLEAMLVDAIHGLVTTTADISSLNVDDEDLSYESIQFEVPDFNDTYEVALNNAIDAALANSVTASWFIEHKYQDMATVYADKTKASIDKVVRLLYTRKKPART